MFSALAAVVFLGSARTTEAQGRRGYGPARRVVVVGGYYASPYWMYDPWYGYDQWGIYGYPPPYRYYNMDPGASVRLEVKPKEAEVYVDGYYAGIVDDFDGVFQRLRVTPGEHEIELYLDGYKTVRQKVYLPVNDTFKIRYTMERLSAGEQPEARPQPINPPSPPQAGGYPPQAGGYPVVACRRLRNSRRTRREADNRRGTARWRSACSRATLKSRSTASSGADPTNAIAWSSRSPKVRTRSRSASPATAPTSPRWTSAAEKRRRST
jgi:hypothetical protein